MAPTLYNCSQNGHGNLPTLNSTLQLTLELANLWLERNGLKLNTLKTKCMLIHSARKKVNSGLELRIDGMDVEQVQCFKFLGVLVNDTLTWSDHIDMVCKMSRHWDYN